ncbi:MAG: ParB/RepB/Spo0J family partition protein [Candidatus Electryoneaceae bacterium]|nr:ParB/RepB/Spo0J family partition protein [Candidatus Electryoneaceae bacterium]
MKKKKGLGRGLSALLPEVDDANDKDIASAVVSIEEIRPNRHQPRQSFDPDELTDLSESIREKGIIQPLIVRRTDNGYELIAGERRLRAARMAGFGEVPVRVLEVLSDAEMLELSLIENLQREDLNPVELARGYRKLHQAWGLTHEKIAKRVGKERATIANTVRLLELPDPILDALKIGTVTAGHAKALLSVSDEMRQNLLFKRIIREKLSVRQTEEFARRLNDASPYNRPQKTTPLVPSHFRTYTDNLRHRFGTKVKISQKGKRGSIQIEFYSDEDLERLMELLAGES